MTILTTIEELKTHVEVASSLKMPTVRPSINTAERRNLKSCLGETLFGRLLTAYADAENKIPDMDEELQELAELSQGVVANIAMSLLISRLSVSISDAGVTRLENTNQKTAFQYQEVNLRESYLRVGFDGLDEILSYLESNKATFADWVSSSSYIDYTKYFIQSAEQFSGYYNIQQSRLAFLSVRYIMKRIEDFQVKDIVSARLFKTLKDQLKASNVTEANLILLDDYIRPGVALLTIANGVWERALDISENGVTVSMKGSTDNNQLRQAAEIAKQQKMADQLLAAGNEYLSRLAVFLSENGEDYPDFDLPLTASKLFTIDNKIENGIYGV